MITYTDKSLREKRKATKFDWDNFNKDKNWIKHKVDFREGEEVFFNKPLKIYPDLEHSSREKRFLGLGRTNKFRKLTIIFTLREKKIRIISARDQNKKERRKYEETIKAHPSF